MRISPFAPSLGADLQVARVHTHSDKPACKLVPSPPSQDSSKTTLPGPSLLLLTHLSEGNCAVCLSKRGPKGCCRKGGFLPLPPTRHRRGTPDLALASVCGWVAHGGVHPYRWPGDKVTGVVVDGRKLWSLWQYRAQKTLAELVIERHPTGRWKVLLEIFASLSF